MGNPDNGASLFFPAQASTLAPDVDRLFYFILTLCTIFFVLIICAGIYFVVKYRHRPGGPEAVPISHNTALEVAWSVGPLFLLFIIFAWGYRGYLNAAVAPRDAMEIQVRGKKWLWEFEYPDGINSPGEIVVPVNKPVKLIMQGQDVLHSFYVPAFRLKQDVIPNRYTTMWFTATQTGTFDVFCAEYCGDNHSGMLAKLRVMTEEGYQKWVEENGAPKGPPSAEEGKKLFAKNACAACHQVVASGPSQPCPNLWNAFGRKEKLMDGSEVAVDENYIRESILRPQAKVVQGYGPTSAMPAFEGSLKDRQIDALIMYIKTLK